MTQQQLADQFHNQYTNAQADVILGKNLDEHYLAILPIINDLNARIDQEYLSGNITGAESFIKMTYHYYRLKDDIITAMGNRG